MTAQLTPDELYLLHERIAIKMDSDASLADAEYQSWQELFPPLLARPEAA